MFTAAPFTIVKTWKQHKCPSTDKWIKKDVTYTHTHTYIYTHTHAHIYIHTRTMEYYAVIKRNEIMPFAAT